MAEAALSEARALGDEAAEAKILWNQLNVNRLIQHLPQARAAGEHSLEIARRLGLEAQAALSVHDLTHVYASLGLWPWDRSTSYCALNAPWIRPMSTLRWPQRSL